MKVRHILLLLLTSFWTSFIFSQEPEPEKKRKPIDVFVGADLLAPAFGVFTDKKGVEASISIQAAERWSFAFEVGREENLYDENDWDLESKGQFARIGFNRFLITDHYENPRNCFYTGLRFALSTYDRKADAVPVRFDNPELNTTTSFPEENITAYWLEIPVGARVELFKTNFYADFSARLKVLLDGSTGESNVDPLAIPSFGIEQSGLNLGVNWSLVYRLPIRK